MRHNRHAGRGVSAEGSGPADCNGTFASGLWGGGTFWPQAPVRGQQRVGAGLFLEPLSYVKTTAGHIDGEG